MCGIFAYSGEKPVIPLLLSGLQKLEYRGYDSAGIAVLSSKKVNRVQSIGKVSKLATKVRESGVDIHQYFSGIAHTRWATHGGVTLENTHPHISQSGRFVLVHNGIVENYLDLKKLLTSHGYTFVGETDSEVLVNFIEYSFQEDLCTTLGKVAPMITGAYAIVVMDREDPDTMIGIKLGSPLVVGVRGNNFFLSSDSQALRGETDIYIPLDDRDIVIIQKEQYTIISDEKNRKTSFRSGEGIRENDLDGFEHYMHKEIFENPSIIENLVNGRMDMQTYEISSATLESMDFARTNRIEIIASGTSYHAGREGSYFFENIANIPTRVHIASEYKYQKQWISPDTLYIFLSQSGETADTLSCAKMIKMQGGKTFGIINVVGSSIARMCETGWYTHCGVEVGVAATKTFIGQVLSLYMMALYVGKCGGQSYHLSDSYLRELPVLKDVISQVLSNEKHIQKVAQKYAHAQNMFFLGRGHFSPIALEGSLKCKEITYIHSEAYPAGELKHGPLSLITNAFPTVLINPESTLYEKNISTLKEIQSRGGKVIGIISQGDANADQYDDVITIPSTSEYVSLFSVTVALQLFAYYMAKELGREIDTPKNLAKSVTVE